MIVRPRMSTSTFRKIGRSGEGFTAWAVPRKGKLNSRFYANVRRRAGGRLPFFPVFLRRGNHLRGRFVEPLGRAFFEIRGDAIDARRTQMQIRRFPAHR